MAINYADIAIIAILVLAFIVGLVRGFWRTFSKLLTLIIALVLGFVFADKLSVLIFNESALTSINNVIYKLVSSNPFASATIVENGSQMMAVTSDGTIKTIEEALKLMLVPDFLYSVVIATASTGATLGTIVSSAYTHMTALVLSGLILFVGSLIVLRIIAALIYNATCRNYLRPLDRILGGVFRLLTGSLFILIIIHLLHFMSGFEFMDSVITHVEEGKISGYLYKLDLFNTLFYGEGFTKIMELFKSIIPAPSAPETQALIMSILG